MTVFTIGYEGLSVSAFMKLLADHGVETVVDIRERPLSRKPGFSKRSLADLLTLSGYGYLHVAELGCPKPIRDRYREDGDWGRYTKAFLKHLQNQEAAIAELSARIGTSNCALLCYEADHNFCHRSMVAHAVSQYCDAAILHIHGSALKKAPPENLRLALA